MHANDLEIFARRERNFVGLSHSPERLLSVIYSRLKLRAANVLRDMTECLIPSCANEMTVKRSEGSPLTRSKRN